MAEVLSASKLDLHQHHRLPTWFEDGLVARERRRYYRVSIDTPLTGQCSSLDFRLLPSIIQLIQAIWNYLIELVACSFEAHHHQRNDQIGTGSDENRNASPMYEWLEVLALGNSRQICSL